MKISVIIPYDIDRGFLSEAIRSAENQNFDNYEIIVEQGDGFLGVNANNGIRKAKGEWIKLLSEDDILPPNALADLWNGRDGHRWVCGDAENFGYLKDGWEYSPIYKSKVTSLPEMLHRNSIHGGTTLYERKLLLEIGGYDESLWTGEEYDLHLFLFARDIIPGYVPKIVYKYRIHDKNKSMDLSARDKIKRRQFIADRIKTRYL